MTIRILRIAMFLLAFSGCGGGGDSIPVTMQLSATATSPSEVYLSWSPHAGSLSGYNVYRNGEKIFSLITGTSLFDRSLKTNTQYCYLIYAIDPLGVAGQSNQACVKTLGTTGWNIELIGEGGNPSLALDSGNQPHVGYRDVNGVMHSYKSSGSWQHSVVDNTAGSYGGLDLVIDGFGADRISYANTVNARLIHASNATGVWLRNEVDDIGYHTNAITVDGAGNAHLAYTQSISSSNALIYANNVSGSWESEFISGFGSKIQRIDMLIDASGTLHVAYVVGAMPWPCAVRYAQKTVTGWTDTVVEPETRCGISLAMDSKEIVHIVYPRQFNLAHAFKDGDDWQIEVVDTFSWVGGEDTTLAIDEADRLHVAYYDQNDDLKYATNLNGAWQHYFINGAITGSPSIAVDSAGTVSIAYSDQVDGTVKLMVKP